MAYVKWSSYYDQFKVYDAMPEGFYIMPKPPSLTPIGFEFIYNRKSMLTGGKIALLRISAPKENKEGTTSKKPKTHKIMATKKKTAKPADKDAIIERQKQRIEQLKKNKGKEPRKKSTKPATPAQLAARKMVKKASDLATKLQIASGKVELDCKKWRYKMYRDDAMKKAWQQLKG